MQIKLSSTAIRHLQEIIDSHLEYLTDYREYSLQDVITQLEPELFRKVTGLTLKDFGLLVGLGVFNRELMNDAVYKFKRYEDASLSYSGINTHNDTVVGGWDEVKQA